MLYRVQKLLLSALTAKPVLAAHALAQTGEATALVLHALSVTEFKYGSKLKLSSCTHNFTGQTPTRQVWGSWTPPPPPPVAHNRTGEWLEA